jgi:protein-disulfide isomerase
MLSAAPTPVTDTAAPRRSTPLKSNTSNYASRRARRAAARREASPATRTQAAPASRPFWRSPIFLLTGGVLVVAIVAVAALQFLGGHGSSGPAVPGTRTSAGILVPAVGTPMQMADGRALGRVDAPLTLTVWSDFQCPNCKIFAEQTEGRIVTNYVNTGKLRLVYHDMDIIDPAPGGLSDSAATAARCADQQGKFWQYHDVLFANQGAENSGWTSRQGLDNMADAIGLDRTKFDRCLGDNDIFNAVRAETKQGLALGNGTPLLDFGSLQVPGARSYADLSVIIDKLLAGALASPGASASAGGSPAAGASGQPVPSGAAASPAASPASSASGTP